MKYFITYGDEKFKSAKERICYQATHTKEFDKVIPYGPEDLSNELLESKIIKLPRGGGLWSWKPDVIVKTMTQAEDGDIIVYCDSGCTLSPSIEWKWYWRRLNTYELIAQRLLQRNYKWTRKEIIDAFPVNEGKWLSCYQYEATVIMLVVSDFTRQIMREWRQLMINKPALVMDVPKDELHKQYKGFVENRHDQALFSALVYKYLYNEAFKSHIYTCWERIEDCRLFGKQAIRATRLRHGEDESFFLRNKSRFKRVIKHYIMVPFYYSLSQWWNS